MNTYGRYVHVFFGVLLMIPLLIFISQVEALILALFAVVAVFCAISGATLIVRAVAAPSLPVSNKQPESVLPS